MLSESISNTIIWGWGFLPGTIRYHTYPTVHYQRGKGYDGKYNLCIEAMGFLQRNTIIIHRARLLRHPRSHSDSPPTYSSDLGKYFMPSCVFSAPLLDSTSPGWSRGVWAWYTQGHRKCPSIDRCASPWRPSGVLGYCSLQFADQGAQGPQDRSLVRELGYLLVPPYLKWRPCRRDARFS